MNRRDLLRGALLGGAALTIPTAWAQVPENQETPADPAALERRHGGRLGVAALDTQSGQYLSHRGKERFPLCSTFKLLLAAAVLERVDKGKEQLDRRVVFGQDALLGWAPVTRLNVGPPGMSIEELCEAIILMSDNTAANLLLNTMGGPPALTAWVARLGDGKTRLDHHEPLSHKHHGEDDTTLPQLMLADMQKILLGDVLPDDLRNRLKNWFMLSQTGSQTLAAGLPSNWRIGDKTGSDRHTNNDVALIRPPNRKPLLVAAYYVNPNADTAARKAVLADVGRWLTAWQAEGKS